MATMMAPVVRKGLKVIGLAVALSLGWILRGAAMEEPAPLAPEEARCLVAAARGSLEGGGAPASCLPRGRVLAVVITAWGAGEHSGRSWSALAVANQEAGAPVSALLPAAGAELAQRLSAEGARPADELLRLKVDLVVDRRPVLLARPWYLDIRMRPGIDGLWLGGASDEIIVPSYSIEAGVHAGSWAFERLEHHAQRGEGPAWRIRTRAAVAGPEESPEGRPVYRGNVLLPPVGSAAVKGGVRRAASYLARMVDAAGRLCPQYDATHDRCSDDYNSLRHAGATYALIQAARLVGDPDLHSAARRANDYLLTQARPSPDAPETLMILEDGAARLGASALALLALAEFTAATGDERYRPQLKALGAYLLSRQRADGDFFSHHAWQMGMKVPAEQVPHYAAEALLALIKLYEIDPDPRWLGAAVSAADYLVERRLRWGPLEWDVPADPWLVLGLVALDGWVPKASWEEYVFRVTRTMARLHLQAADGDVPPDLLGGPVGGLELSATLPAGPHLAAFTAAWQLARRLGRPGQMQVLEELALSTARFSLQQQYRPENSWFLPAPARALGGVRLRPDEQIVRNDAVHHNLIGLLGVLDVLDAREGEL